MSFCKDVISIPLYIVFFHFMSHVVDLSGLSTCDKSIRGFHRSYIDTVRCNGIDPSVIRPQKVVALFSSVNDLQQEIINCINAEQESIQIAMYLFTDSTIANAIIDAYQRGISVELIIDKDCMYTTHSIIPHLSDSGISISISSSMMHNKYVIFCSNKDDQPLLWTGSYNFTYQAKSANKENVLLVRDRKVISDYRHQFELLKQQSKSLFRLKKQKRKQYKYKKKKAKKRR